MHQYHFFFFFIYMNAYVNHSHTLLNWIPLTNYIGSGHLFKKRSEKEKMKTKKKWFNCNCINKKKKNYPFYQIIKRQILSLLGLSVARLFFDNICVLSFIHRLKIKRCEKNVYNKAVIKLSENFEFSWKRKNQVEKEWLWTLTVLFLLNKI